MSERVGTGHKTEDNECGKGHGMLNEGVMGHDCSGTIQCMCICIGDVLGRSYCV